MTDRGRWLETGERGLAQHLLRAAVAEVAPDAVRANVLDAVNGALPELPITPGASPPQAGGGAGTAPGAGLSPGVLAKGAAAVAVAHPVAASTLAVLVFALGAVAHHAIRGAPKSEAASVSPAAALPRSHELEPPRHVPSSGAGPSPTSPGPNASPAQSEPPSRPLRHPAARPRPAPPATPPRAAAATGVAPQRPPPRDHLGEQLTLLARARQHLRTGQPHTALTVLTAFEQQFPEGALLPEVTVLRQRAERQMAERAPPSGERPPD